MFIFAPFRWVLKELWVMFLERPGHYPVDEVLARSAAIRFARKHGVDNEPLQCTLRRGVWKVVFDEDVTGPNRWVGISAKTGRVVELYLIGGLYERIKDDEWLPE